MYERNDGISESNILQNQFTAYLLVAVRRAKARYLRAQNQQRQYEQPLDYHAIIDPDMTLGLPHLAQLENNRLQQALMSATQLGQIILLVKILEDRTFSEIAAELGMSPKTVSSIYYRLIEKIRKQLGGENN